MVVAYVTVHGCAGITESPVEDLGIPWAALKDRGGGFVATESSDSVLRGGLQMLAGLSVGLAFKRGFFKCKLSTILSQGRMAFGPWIASGPVCANGRGCDGGARAASVRFVAGYVAVGVAVGGSV